MNGFNRRIVNTPFLGRFLLFLYRARTSLTYFYKPLYRLLIWLFKSKETTNYTYDLEETNKRYLCSLIADITNETFDAILSFISEIDEDNELRAHIRDATVNSDHAFMADAEVRFGRRVGWYAFARALKPRIIVETGVDKGLGSCLLAAAVKKNQQEGYEGRYYGTDIDPNAGYLLSGDYARFGRILYGDSVGSLQAFDGVIDLFINDSDHSADYEAEEYKTVATKLSEDAIILGDNSHSTNKLLEFSLKMNRHFIFFHEKPKGHWYPGAGIGISFKRQPARQNRRYP